MSPIAICVGSTVIYWSSILICLAAAVCFCLSYALYTANGGRSSVLWCFLPLMLVFSLLFSRLIHWYCHSEQYAGLLSAMTDYSAGGYCMPGVLFGVALAALVSCGMHKGERLSALLDALAPGTALGIALLRLSNLFSNACRGKIILDNPRLQHLPLGAAVSTVGGGVQYRFAAFFVSFLLLLLLAVLLLLFYGRSRSLRMRAGPSQGHTALVFLLYFCALEFVIDSSRYDSSFLRSNGFVSLMQILCALVFVAILIYYSVLSLRARGLHPWHWAAWIVFLAAAGCTGYFEYLIQRHGDWVKLCYSVMSLSTLSMASIPLLLFRTVRH